MFELTDTLYALQDHKDLYRVLVTNLDVDREISMATMGATLLHSGMKARFGYGKPKPFLEHFTEFLEFRDRVAGGVPQRWVIIRRIPEWDAELGLDVAASGDEGIAAGGEQGGEPASAPSGSSAQAAATASDSAVPPLCSESNESAFAGALAASAGVFDAPAAHIDATHAAPTESAAASLAQTSGHEAASSPDPSPGAIAAAAASSDKYRNDPIDEATRTELSPDFESFVFVPYASADVLRAHVPPATNVNELLEKSWSAAFAAGALRAYENKVTFPVAAMRSDGVTPIEASVQRVYRDNPEHKPWYLCYVDAKAPFVPRPRVQVDAPSEQALTIAREMAATNEYREEALPAHVEEQMRDRYSDFVFTTYSSRSIIQDAEPGVDVDYLLEESWMAARQTGALRYYEGKVVFPLNAFCSDGVSPIEASITVATKGNVENKPWYLCYIDTYAKRNTFVSDHPSKHLEKFAWLGTWDDFLSDLAEIALPELWDFQDGESEGVRIGASGCEASPEQEAVDSLRSVGLQVVSAPPKHRFTILKSYICTTFFRLESEGKICIADDRSFAAFNTGLVNKRYDDIYACFERNSSAWIDEWEWKFAGFTTSGKRGLGKRLVELFNPLPEPAEYFDRKEDLLYDLDKELIIDDDHVLIDNMSRLPLDFLVEELRGDDDAMDIIDEIRKADMAGKRRLYKELGDILMDDTRLFRRVRARLNEAVDTAKKRVRWNFKTAIPSYYPRGNTMSLLLPICLMDDDVADAALVVQLMPSGNYQGQTILTMRQAYTNARLICRPDSDWLTTSSRANEDDDGEDEE